MKKLKMTATADLTFEEGCNKYLEYCRQRNLRDLIATFHYFMKEGYIPHFKMHGNKYDVLPE